ncbi:MAG: SPOR domain-containing protein [Gammaproteobacteria bacterium]|nr:SPOR domain-containing protein [Gammaproteobacteria bacterium]
MATKRKAGRKKKKQQTPGWIWLLAGLSIGLAIAAGVYVKDRGGTTKMLKKAAESVKAIPKPNKTIKENEDDSIDFSFYTILPGLDVEVPDEEYSSKPVAPPKTIDTPGAYLLQVGSYRLNKDADRMKASLALSGIIAKIQRVTVNGNTYHRVLVGPISNLPLLNRTRSQLQDMKIKAMTIQVSN